MELILLFIGGSEIILILLVVLLLFGTKGLADVAKTVGKGLGEFRKVSDDLKSEISKAENEVNSTTNANTASSQHNSEKTENQ